MRRLTTALKWFAYGIGLGLLFAPRSGKETRTQVMQSVSTYVSQTLSAGSQKARQAGNQMDQASYSVREAGSTGSTGTTFSGPA
ncbi:MAG: YtxH domain-containing protein [Chloroflexota bacterium]|nr:YtxH domain-containing protein [Chloroflexota bacterium]